MPEAQPITHELFKPGDRSKASGIYQVVHQPAHRQPHKLILRRGEVFPSCRSCEHTVFLLVIAVEHLSDDPDFAGPAK